MGDLFHCSTDRGDDYAVGRTRGDPYPYIYPHSYANSYSYIYSRSYANTYTIPNLHPHSNYGSGTAVGGFVNTLSP